MAAPSSRQLESLIRRAIRTQELDRAEQASRRLASAEPTNPISYWVLAQIERNRGNGSEAAAHLRTCIQLDPAKRSYRLALAKVLRSTGEVSAAFAELGTLLEMDPSCAEAELEKADLLEHTGRYEEADFILKRLRSEGTAPVAVAEIQARLALHRGEFAQVLDVTAAALKESRPDDPANVPLLFARAQAFDRLNDPPNALQAAGAANQLIRIPWDRNTFQQELEQITRFFDAARLESCLAASESRLPIFIAAMPRSGTSLLDQVFDSHPDASGGGELDYFYRFRIEAQRGRRNSYPSLLGDCTEQQARRLAHGYLQLLSERGGGASQRVSDKSIENFRELGLIAWLFPRATYVDLRRDPVDCCLSIYLHPLYNFAAQTSSFGDVAAFYAGYVGYMRHWRQLLGDRLLAVEYEQLVADPRSELQRLLTHCGLPWDEACLDFYRSARLVRTLSYHQVSRPIDASRVGFSKKYQPYLGELIAELERRSII